jgi:hypothetical protein
MIKGATKLSEDLAKRGGTVGTARQHLALLHTIVLSFMSSSSRSTSQGRTSQSEWLQIGFHPQHRRNDPVLLAVVALGDASSRI